MTAAAFDVELNAWAEDEIRSWSGYERLGGELADALQDAADRSGSTFIFDVQGREIKIRTKPGLYTCNQPKGSDHPYIKRAELYQHFFESILASTNREAAFAFAIDVDDESAAWQDYPVLTYSKKVGSKNILIPDVDFLYNAFYTDFPRLRTTNAFESKNDIAIFAGSTSGVHNISLHDLRMNSVPRIRSARFFKNKPFVDFRLPNLVQCESEEVISVLKAEGFGSDPIDWDSQLTNKFILSIDGNGATCSRVFIALRSDSVLLKYDSPWLMYYFKGLKPSWHFLPIKNDEEVESIVAEEIAQPGRYGHIAQAGRQFATDFLEERGVRSYAKSTLALYAERFFPPS